MTYPYVMSGPKLNGFLKKLAEVGKPDKITLKYLKSLGYTSSNDKRMLPVLKFIGLVDGNGVPTADWKAFRVKPESAVAAGIRKGYAELFSQYPNAQQKDDEALRQFFSAHTDLGVGAITKVVSTFKALCQFAHFEAAEATSAEAPPKPIPKAPKVPAVTKTGHMGEGPTVNINVQLQVPADATGEIYDKFFSAMKKHLWPPEE